MANSKYTPERLAEIARSSYSVMEVVRSLGLKPSGGNHSNIKSLLTKYSIDISHFLGSGSNKGKPSNLKKGPEEILKDRSLEEYPYRQKRRLLLRAMQESGVSYLCGLCGVLPIWNGQPLTLEIDHVDGNWRDDRLVNLRFLCPNCHSQQPTNKSNFSK